MRPLTLHYAPRTRSLAALSLLEELGVPFTLAVVDTRNGANLAPAFRAINPLGKVPALVDGTTVVTEQVAILLHLADLCPAAGLAPAADAPDRGHYLRAMVFYAAAFEPALIDRARGVEPGGRAMSPYGAFDEVIAAVRGFLVPGPFILGERFSAADVLWAVALNWVTGFGLVERTPDAAAYVERVLARPAMARAAARDAALAGA